MAKIPIIYQANIDSAFEGVKSLFPFEYGGRTLELNNLTLGKFPDPFDKEAQKAHRLSGEKWSVPMQGEFTLKQDGKVLDKGNLRLMNIPVPTSEGTYIMSRGEYHPFFQPRLKPGVYTRKRSTGEAEAQFNLSTGSNFTMQYDPGKKLFSVRYKATRAPLYHVMNAVGVSDSEMRNAWGSDIFEANKAAPSRLKYLAKSAKVDVDTEDQAKQVVKDVFRAMEISTPEVPEKTLGYRTKQVGGPLLLLASQKVRRVHLGDEEPDNRESPRFKWMMDPSAYVKERTQRSEIHQKLRRRMRRHDTVRGVFGSSAPLDVDVWKIFTSAGLSDRASQTNPVASIMAMNRASILGEGGIGSMNAITAEARGIHPNYLGIFDPVITPEGSKTGVAYPLASGVEIRDREAFLPLTNMKTGKFERVPFSQVVNKSLALSDEVELAKSWKRLIRAVKDGQVIEVSKDKLDFTIRPASTLSIPARLVPFFSSVSPNRAEMAGRFMTQARVIEHNEAPWVQTIIPSTDNSMEQFIGSALLSRKSPVDGVVSQVENGKIHIKGDDGSKNVVHTAYLFPLNDGHSFEHDRVMVQPGDRVKSDQVVAESNAVRDGALALGTNAVVAYMSDGGNNFEDAITISSSFAKRLSVKTLVQKQYDSSDSEISEEKYHRVIAPITAEERSRLDNGIARVGTKVRKGDLIIAAVRTTSLSKEERLFARTKQDALRMQDASIYWDKDHEGVVTEVVDTKKGVYVGVTVDEPARVGDKLATRMANKGVIGRVLMDEEMPKTADGTRIEIMLNPHGVGSRMNSAQVYEAVVGKVAKLRGEPIAVPQFPSEELGDDPRKVEVKQHTRTYYVGPEKKPVKRLIQKYSYEHDFVEAVQKLLDEEGIEAQEEVFVGGKSYGKVLVGNSHILRLMQLSEDKKSIRGYGHPFFYSTDRSPVKGSEEIGEADVEAPQAIGRSMLEALLVHGATANIRDFMTYKADRDNSEVWTAIQEGRPLPPPTMPFVNRKFEAYLTGLGLSIDRSDDSVSLLPMTDEETRKLSNGELDKPTFFSAKTGKSKDGELFDERITGGLDGEGWGHIELPEAYPNPMFIKPISALLGISQTDVVEVAAGRKFLHPGKKHFDADENQEDEVTMLRALKSVNVDKEIEEEKDVKRLKYLHALRKMDKSADVYMMQTVPVVPPVFRPVSPTGDGRPLYADLNILYSELISAATSMKDLQASNPELVNEQEGQQLRGKTYESIAMLYGMAGSTAHNHEAKGIVDQLHGPTSKYGFIQRNMLRRRQDLSARAVIVPGPNLGIDEIGIPFKMALELYKPFVVRELGMTPLRAREMIEEHPDDPAVRVALEMVVAQRPIWAKRDPVLHKFGTMAFYPKLLDNGDGSNAVELHPLVTGGYNADHDGDTMALYVPISPESVLEAKAAVPSRNIKDPATGKFIMAPSLDAATGLFLLTRVTDGEVKNSYPNTIEALKAYAAGTQIASDRIMLGGRETTVGRELVKSLLPPDLQKHLDMGQAAWDKKEFGKFMQVLGGAHPGAYGKIMNKLMRRGYEHTYKAGFSFDLKDFTTQSKIRDELFAEYYKRSNGMTQEQKNKLAMEITDRAGKMVIHDASNPFIQMLIGSGKPGAGNVQQMLMSPMFAPWDGKMIPIRTGFAQGMSSMDFWSMSPSARQGLVDKVSSVSLPGELTKQMVAISIDQVIVSDDCKSDGSVIGVDGALDRRMSRNLGGFRAGTMVTPDIIQELRKQGVKKVPIRSPLACREAHGVCATCYGETENGPAQLGDNVGLRAAQGLGERSTQLSMRNFHTGGFNAEAPAKQLASFLRMPENMPNKASLAQKAGRVTEIRPAIDGLDVVTSDGEKTSTSFVPRTRTVSVSVGDYVKPAQAVSDGAVDPREVLNITKDLPSAQRALVKSISGIYGRYGIQSKHVELLVRGLTNLARVDDPGSSNNLKGDFIPFYAAQAWNRENDGSLDVTPVLKGVTTLPQTRDEWASGMAYRNVRQLLGRAASLGREGPHPHLEPTCIFAPGPNAVWQGPGQGRSNVLGGPMKSLVAKRDVLKSLGKVGPSMSTIKHKDVLKSMGQANVIRGQPKASGVLGTPSTNSLVGKSGSMPKTVLARRQSLTPTPASTPVSAASVATTPTAAPTVKSVLSKTPAAVKAPSTPGV